MNVIRPNINVERLIGRLGFLHEGNRCVNETTGDLRALHPGDRFPQSYGVSPNLSDGTVTGFC